MVEMSMRERLARAICKANCPPSMSDDDKTCQTESAWDLWLSEADAVLEALREPDEGMVEAGFRAREHGMTMEQSAAATFTAMIDHARNDGKE